MDHHQHDHALGHGHIHTGDAARLLGAFGVIAVFMLIEIVGGLMSGSLALLADATHMFADAAALGLAASAQILARRPADHRRHFGYQRVQVLAAFFNGVTLLMLALWIVIEAIQRFLNPRPVEAGLMLAVAIAGLIANAIAFWVLQDSKTRNVNIKGALLHVAADLASSVVAIIAAFAISIGGSPRFDPLLSLLVAALVSYSAVRLLIETGHILLEGAPKGINVTALSDGVKRSAPEVEDVHDVRIWQITPDSARLTLHARIRNSADAEMALERIKAYLEKEHGIRQSTVQIEIGDDCPDCDDVHDHAQHAHEPEPLRPAAAAERHVHHNPGHVHGRPAMANHK